MPDARTDSPEISYNGGVPAILHAHVFIMSSSISVNMIFIVCNKVIIKAVPKRAGTETSTFPGARGSTRVPE